MESIIAFMVVSFFTVASPGPSTLFIVRQGAKFGFMAAFGGVAGILLADTIFLIAGSVGVGAALTASAWLLTALKLVGVGYFGLLAWRIGRPYLVPTVRGVLGAVGLMQAVPMLAAAQVAMQSTVTTPSPWTPAVAISGSVWTSWRHAFTMHVVNVKALLFFAMLVPQFVVAGKPLPGQVAGLLGLHLAVAASVLTGYAMAGTVMCRTQIGAAASRVLDMLSSGVMLALSIGILATIR